MIYIYIYIYITPIGCAGTGRGSRLGQLDARRQSLGR